MTKQESESQTSTSSRFIVGAANRAGLAASTGLAVLTCYLNTRTQSCHCAPMICVLRPGERQIERALPQADFAREPFSLDAVSPANPLSALACSPALEFS